MFTTTIGTVQLLFISIFYLSVITINFVGRKCSIIFVMCNILINNSCHQLGHQDLEYSERYGQIGIWFSLRHFSVQFSFTRMHRTFSLCSRNQRHEIIINITFYREDHSEILQFPNKDLGVKHLHTKHNLDVPSFFRIFHCLLQLGNNHLD